MTFDEWNNATDGERLKAYCALRARVAELEKDAAAAIGLAMTITTLRAKVAALEAVLKQMASAGRDRKRDWFVVLARDALNRTSASAPSVHTPKPTCKECGQFLDSRGKCRVPEHNP